MNINWTQPITVYELIAIALSTIALIIPLIKYIYNHFIKKLKETDVLAVFHYLSLHSSDYYTKKHDGRKLANCDMFAVCLVRLPMYYELEETGVEQICEIIKS